MPMVTKIWINWDVSGRGPRRYCLHRVSKLTSSNQIVRSSLFHSPNLPVPSNSYPITQILLLHQWIGNSWRDWPQWRGIWALHRFYKECSPPSSSGPPSSWKGWPGSYGTRRSCSTLNWDHRIGWFSHHYPKHQFPSSHTNVDGWCTGLHTWNRLKGLPKDPRKTYSASR